METKSYYNTFSGWYERERGRGYHALLDGLEVDLALPYAKGRDVLEAGCGTGLILSRLAQVARRAVGLDISSGMLERARQRGLQVMLGSLTHLPFPDASFDLVCSFKVLAHVQPIAQALAELTRVTRPGGHMVLEFYNPWSIRYLVKAMKPPSRVSEATVDTQVFTRYDSLSEVKWMMPANTVIERVRGIRVILPTAYMLKVPGLSRLLTAAEWAVADSFLARYGGFLAVVARREG